MENITPIVDVFVFTFMAFVVSMIWTPFLTNLLYKFKIAKQIAEKSWDGAEVPVFQKFHGHKAGTPTMGGLIVVVTTFILTLLFNLDRNQTWLPLFVLVATGILGAFDDISNIRGKGSIKGMGIRSKMLWQLVITALGAWWFYSKLGFDSIHFPGVGDFHLGFWYVPFFIFFVVGFMNCVDITDGLDGLSGGTLSIAFAAFGVIAYSQGNILLAIFCATIIGSLITFLWFNIHPARFFMGGTGAYALGATLAVIAFLTNSVVALCIIGALFILEGSSSLIQRFSRKFFKKKVFISAPFHHHLQALGWPETKIVMRAWLLAAVLAIIGMAIGIIGMGVH
ncbi:MAG: phospho-N-acetylmuramoyl-pentapeptide-transferase [Patescibacteria group bacterium]